MIYNEHRIITQIYAAQSYEEVKALIDIGVDYIGVVVGLHANVPGVYNPKKTNEILRDVGGHSKKIILPFTDILNDIVKIMDETQADIVHIAAEPEAIDSNTIAHLKRQFPDTPIMRTIPIVDEKSIDMAREYEGIADYLLLDTRNKSTNQLGVTGQVHDWSISKRIVESVSIPVILAGGLGPDNVAEAISVVRPFGVDSKTKTDITDTDFKDLDKVKSFVENTRRSLC